MKILSTFDTRQKRRELQRNKQQYGDENVFLICKSRLFGMIYVRVPLYAIIIGLALIAYMTHSFFGEKGLTYVFLPFAATIVLVATRPIIKKYIDYKMDFAIITPEYVYMYNQTGILKISTVTLETRNIKSVTIKKAGLLYSLFDNGDIYVLAEGAEMTSKADVVFFYVRDPEKVKERFNEIIRLGESHRMKKIREEL